MKKIKFNYDEEIIEETLENGLKIYLYKTEKTNNFYITVSTHFGAEVMSYKKGSTKYEVTKGSAHFLEHRVMDFTKNKEAMKKINEYGSLVNAYTTYSGTNYNIFGNGNVIENMELLFDRVFKANIKKEDVEMERGIILEEYSMYFDDPYFILYNNLNKNAFNTSYLKYPVLGTKEGIETVKTEELKRLYKDFYIPNNMFIVVTGNFEINEVLDYIKKYTKNLKKQELPKIIKPKEKEQIETEYEELNMQVNEPKIIVGYKTELPKDVNLTKYKIMIHMALSNEFGSTGNAYEELNNLGIKRIGFGTEVSDNYILINFKASTDKPNEFLNIVEKYMSNLQIDEESLERKKRGRLSTLILSFEDIMGIEDNITTDVLTYNKVINNRDEIVKSITLKEINDVLKNINIKNKSILKIVGK